MTAIYSGFFGVLSRGFYLSCVYVRALGGEGLVG